MAKLIKTRLLGCLVCLLLLVAVSGVVSTAFSVVETNLTRAETETLREERYSALGQCNPASPEELSGEIDEAQESFYDTQNCVSTTSMLNSMKSTDKTFKSAYQEFGIPKPYQPTDLANGACSKTDKKMMAEQEQHGPVAGYLEGLDGAETMADLPGSPAEYALISQNVTNCHQQKLAEMGQVAPSFNWFCQQNPDACPQNASHWLAPIAVAQAQVDSLQFSVAHQQRLGQIAQSLEASNEVTDRASFQRSQHALYNHLSKAQDAEMDATQALIGKAEVAKQAAIVMAKDKFDEGGVSHNCSTVSENTRSTLDLLAWWQPTTNVCESV